MKHGAFVLLTICLVAACSGNSHSSMMPSSMPFSPGSLSGTWSLSDQMAPSVSSCTGSLSAASYSFCPSYTFVLTEGMGNFSGTATASCYTGTLSVTGTINGTTFMGTASFTTGSGAVLNIEFSGSVSGSSMTLTPTSFGVQGTMDSCQVSGTYTGSVQSSLGVGPGAVAGTDPSLRSRGRRPLGPGTGSQSVHGPPTVRKRREG